MRRISEGFYAAVLSAFLLCSGGTGASAQEPDSSFFRQPDSTYFAKPDTLLAAAPETLLSEPDGTLGPEDSGAIEQETVLSTEDRLKAKVDSLKNALSEVSPQRRMLSAEALLREADSLRLNYDFPKAVDTYRRAQGEAADSSQLERISEAMLLGQNGLNMMGYCSHPVVVAKKRFPLEDFFLMYPLEDRSWRKTPNSIDKDSDPFAKATYIPDSTATIYYSARDREGIRNIYLTNLLDGDIWSEPELINEQLTSGSNEIFPSISPDGRTLYFASEGLYGMGGYDLYMSQWNRQTKDWDTPINMGFPYSSPYDDFLFINTEDGKHSIFASNRECSRDSVYIYILEYDAMPVRKAVSDVRTLRTLSELTPEKKESERDAKPAEEDNSGSNLNAYKEKMAVVRTMRDSIYTYNKELDALRGQLSESGPDEQNELLAEILAKEAGLPILQHQLEIVVSELQDIEMDFLSSGIVIDPGQMDDEPEPEPEDSAFEFIRHSMGDELVLVMEEPEEEEESSEFEILPEGRFSENNILPDGIIYQIQIASGAGRLNVKDIKGLSPVFMKMSTSLRYTYTVGVFRRYRDVLSNLNRVRSLGFRDAFIVAFKDGRSISVDSAREEESPEEE